MSSTRELVTGERSVLNPRTSGPASHMTIRNHVANNHTHGTLDLHSPPRCSHRSSILSFSARHPSASPNASCISAVGHGTPLASQVFKPPSFIMAQILEFMGTNPLGAGDFARPWQRPPLATFLPIPTTINHKIRKIQQGKNAPKRCRNALCGSLCAQGSHENFSRDNVNNQPQDRTDNIHRGEVVSLSESDPRRSISTRRMYLSTFLCLRNPCD